MPKVAPLLTYLDVYELLARFATKHGGEAPQEALHRAIQGAYEEIAGYRWSFLERNGRVFINARQTTGTVVYDHTGGATCERQLTMSGATFPSWSINASIRFGSGDVVCDIESIENDPTNTIVMLDAAMNPGEDVASSSFTLYQRWVWLPADFVSFTGAMPESTWRLGLPRTLTEITAMDRFNPSYGDILYHCVAEVPDVYDRKAMFLYPQADASETIDFVYRRQPRVLRYSGQNTSDYAGTLTLTSGSATVEGSSTAFASDMAGAVLRTYSTSGERPTGRFGRTPYLEEYVIKSVTDSDTLVLMSNATTSRSAVKYVISDPVDLNRIAHNAFLRCCENQLARSENYQDEHGRIYASYRKTLRQAKGTDNADEYDPTPTTPGGFPGSYNLSSD